MPLNDVQLIFKHCKIIENNSIEIIHPFKKRNKNLYGANHFFFSKEIHELSNNHGISIKHLLQYFKITDSSYECLTPKANNFLRPNYLFNF